jgi:hypothetical protein
MSENDISNVVKNLTNTFYSLETRQRLLTQDPEDKKDKVRTPKLRIGFLTKSSGVYLRHESLVAD